MRHSHGLRAAAAAAGGIAGPAIGDSYGGGFFAGYISHTADGIATHALIVAPAATGATGTGGYTLTTNLQWKEYFTTTIGATSLFDGAENTAVMLGDAYYHAAAEFCGTLSIGGYTDWYLPARYELDIAYQNLKPTTASNSTSFGVNVYSVPARASNRTAGAPAQTSVAAFQSGGAEAFVSNLHWSSTDSTGTSARVVSFGNGVTANASRTSASRVRAFRKLAL